jgi:hypothetical protein
MTKNGAADFHGDETHLIRGKTGGAGRRAGKIGFSGDRFKPGPDSWLSR